MAVISEYHRKLVTFQRRLTLGWIVTAFCFLGLSGASAKANELTLLAAELVGLHESSGAGAYDLLLASMKTSVELEVRHVPVNRSTAEFDSCTSCCLSPANKNSEFYDFPDDYLVTNPMSVAKVYIWTPPGSEPLSSLDQLTGKTVGGLFGMPYGAAVANSGIQLDRAETISQNIRRLRIGRLDAFIAYVPDAYAAFQKLGIEPFPHDVANPVAIHEDRIVCKPSDAARVFLKEFNAQL